MVRAVLIPESGPQLYGSRGSRTLTSFLAFGLSTCARQGPAGDCPETRDPLSGPCVVVGPSRVRASAFRGPGRRLGPRTSAPLLRTFQPASPPLPSLPHNQHEVEEPVDAWPYVDCNPNVFFCATRAPPPLPLKPEPTSNPIQVNAPAPSPHRKHARGSSGSYGRAVRLRFIPPNSPFPVCHPLASPHDAASRPHPRGQPASVAT